MLADHEQKVNDGWILYYNEEGYPYYYNESTGESEWAEYEEYGEAQNNGYKEADEDVEQGDEGGSEEEEEDDDEDDDIDDDSDDGSDDESESDEDSKAQREQRIFDKVMEQKFLEYLKTPEGIAAAQAELERVGRKVDKRLAKKSSIVEQEYVRSLKSKKKEKNVPSNTVFGKLIETTNAWMFPPPEDKSVSSKSTGSNKHKKGTNGKFDDYNRETKHRHASSNASASNLSAVEAGTGSMGKEPTRGSPSSSRSSSLSSDTGSFSSDDSDIAEIDAPLFSEVPSSWFSIASLKGLLAAFQTPTVVPSDSSRDEGASGSGAASSRSATSTALVATAGGASQPFLPESCVVAAEQSFTVLGGAFVQGFGLLFERLNPVLEGFVNSLLDAQATGPPNSRQAQRRQIAAAVSAAGSTSANATERDMSNLPLAPPSRAPLSARGPPTSTPRSGGGVRPSPRPSPRLSGALGHGYVAPLPASRSRRSTPRMPAPTPTQLSQTHEIKIEDTNANTVPPLPPHQEVQYSLPASSALSSEVHAADAEAGAEAGALAEAEAAMEDVSLSETVSGKDLHLRDPPSAAQHAEVAGVAVVEEVEGDADLPDDTETVVLDAPVAPLQPPSPTEAAAQTLPSPRSPASGRGLEAQYTTDMPPAEEFSEDPSGIADHQLLALALSSQDEQADGEAQEKQQPQLQQQHVRTDAGDDNREESEVAAEGTTESASTETLGAEEVVASGVSESIADCETTAVPFPLRTEPDHPAYAAAEVGAIGDLQDDSVGPAADNVPSEEPASKEEDGGL